MPRSERDNNPRERHENCRAYILCASLRAIRRINPQQPLNFDGYKNQSHRRQVLG